MFTYAPARFLTRFLSAGTIIDGALSAGSCIRQAVVERGFTPGLVGLADAKAEDEAASRWADRAVTSGDGMARLQASGRDGRSLWRDGGGLARTGQGNNEVSRRRAPWIPSTAPHGLGGPAFWPAQQAGDPTEAIPSNQAQRASVGSTEASSPQSP